MANLKASKKDIRKSRKREELNHYQRARLRTLAKKVRVQTEGGELDLAQTTLREYTIYLDRAGRRHLIHPKQADRRKSRMTLYVNKALASKSDPAPATTETVSAPVETTETSE